MKLDPLYLITDRTVPPSGDFLGALRSALKGGVHFLQFREKDLSPRQRWELGCQVMDLAEEFGAQVIVNGDPALAEVLGASGVHLGKESLPIRAVRERLGYKGLIGYSAHSGGEAAKAFEEGADFAVLSPVFPTRSKHSTGPVLGLERFQAEIRTLPASEIGPRVYALGGIGPENAKSCIEAGACGVALIRGILGAGDPAAAATAIRNVIFS